MKLFRRDAGPGVTAYGLEVLRGEVARLASIVGLEPSEVLAFEPGSGPYVVIDSDGVYHWRWAGVDRATDARDDVLYWSFEAATRGNAEVLRTLDPRWAERRAREQP